jgi:hypothetical protein
METSSAARTSKRWSSGRKPTILAWRALDLLDRLDERDRPEPPKRPDVAESYADDPDRLARLVELHVELGLFLLDPRLQDVRGPAGAPTLDRPSPARARRVRLSALKKRAGRSLACGCPAAVADCTI